MGFLSRRKKRLFTGLLIAVTIAVLFSLASQFNLFHGFQLRLSDSLFKAAAISPGADEEDYLVIVAIDDKSLDELGKFSSWPRSCHAELTDRLAEAGARIIVFDILFAEPSPDDGELAEAIDNAGNVILPFVYTDSPQGSTMTGQSGGTYDIIMPVASLEDESLAVGHALTLPDDDGIVRRLPLVIYEDETGRPSLTLAAAAKYLRRPEIIESPVIDNSMDFAGRSVPLDGSGNMLINYTDRSASPLNFRSISYVDALTDDNMAEEFRDKIVVIGVTATALGDKFWTPMGYLMSGVELHASAMHTIITGNFIQPSSCFADVIAIVCLVGLVSVLVARLKVFWAALSVVVLGVLYFLMAFTLFDKGIILNMLHPPLAMVSMFACMNIYNVARERSEKAEIIRTFGRYTSPALVEKILKVSREDMLQLGGESHEVTAMFIDARRFTSISENIRPEIVVNTLNTYLKVMIETIKDCGGMVADFGGDSVMAVWNVPLESGNHARLAVEAAMRTQQAIDRLVLEGSVPLILDFGIGINTGEAVAGNMGSEGHLQYSVIGDCVNVAARLADKAPGGKTWIGEDTLEGLGDYVDARPLDPLMVKGRHEPVTAYEIVSLWDFVSTDNTTHDLNTRTK